MKLISILLSIVCGLLAGCDHLPFSTPDPTKEQIQSALTKFVKQDNSDGDASSFFGYERVTPEAFSVSFQFTNFSFKDEKGATQTISSGEGFAMFDKHSAKSGKWILASVIIGKQGSQKEFYPKIEVQ